ncbi:MAG: hypothetical protein WA129_05860 [Acidovorax sp.]
MTSAPYYSDGADVETARIRWREYLDLPAAEIAARMAQAAAHLVDVEAALADIGARKDKAAARVEEYRQAAEAADTAASESRQPDADVSLDDLAIAKARKEIAREMLPKASAAHYALAQQYRDQEAAFVDASREVQKLAAAQAWAELQSALAPAQAAIAEWLRATGDVAVLVGAPAES